MNRQTALMPYGQIQEIFSKIPDERINRDTTGRSNLNFIESGSVSQDHNDSAILSFANRKKQTQRVPVAPHSNPHPFVNNDDGSERITPAILPQRNMEEEQQISPEVQKIAVSILVSSIDSMSSALILSIGCFLYCQFGFPEWVLFAIFFAICVWHFIRNVYYYFQSDLFNEEESKARLVSEIFDQINTLLILLGLLFHVQSGIFPLVYVAIPIPILNISIWYILNYKEMTKSYLYTSSTIRIYLFVQFIHVSLKLDGFIGWEWKMVFWPSWLVFVLIGLYVLGIGIVIIYSGVQVCRGRKNNNQIQGLIWCFNILLLFDANIFMISIGLKEFLGEGDLDVLTWGFMMTSLWLPASQILTVGLSKNLILFIVQINDDGSSISISEPESNRQMPQSLEVKAKTKKENLRLERITNLPKNVPQFLIKFSASYFQVADFKREIVFGILKSRLKVKGQQQKGLTKPGSQNPAKSGFENLDLSENHQKASNLKNEINSSISRIENIRTESEKSIKACVICCDNAPDAVIMNCGHGGICYQCAVNMWKKGDGTCHLCRKRIEKILQIEKNSKSKVLMPVVAVVERKE